ncbi:hypothetical protein OVS_04270 [Mycoplasma ovis str. Michigan]|uniref:Uncharacterized protein n=1 Tax=Mycoplasma ovis str. Michigan TaxID=1415773 RepID=A0ABN4BMQ1_9MOLU|nr:hypothetical protein [Mycoplasma ovis]AHC40581.1 hypothetical protein OVS_04270 [Mycoplasma ovis str. Michigan]
MSKKYVDILGTQVDKLENLNSLDLKQKCKFETQEKTFPKLICDKYSQELRYRQYYLIPQIVSK